MQQDELTAIYNEIEYNWKEYNNINEVINEEKEFIKNYNYKKNRLKLKYITIKNFFKNLLFKILLAILVKNLIFNILNLSIDISTFFYSAKISYSLITEILSNIKIYKNLNERIDNELLEKMGYIKELSTKKTEIKKKIYELSDIIKMNNDLSNEEKEQELIKAQERSIEEFIIKAEPYIIYEEKAKVLKREINKSKNKRSSNYT